MNNKDFYLALVDYQGKVKICQEEDREIPQMSKYIGQCIMKIAENLGSKYNFVGFSYKDEMISDAIFKMFESVPKYNTEYSNPFAYFSQISWNVFLQRIKEEKKQQYIKHKHFDKLGDEIRSEVNTGDVSFDNENHQKVISDFEASKIKNNNSAGYKPHKNLSYERNRKPKKTVENQ